MTPQQFIEQVCMAQVAELEKHLRALADGETLCLHERRYEGVYRVEINAHVLTSGRKCNSAGRLEQYGPMTPEIRAAAAESAPTG